MKELVSAVRKGRESAVNTIAQPFIAKLDAPKCGQYQPKKIDVLLQHSDKINDSNLKEIERERDGF